MLSEVAGWRGALDAMLASPKAWGARGASQQGLFEIHEIGRVEPVEILDLEPLRDVFEDIARGVVAYRTSSRNLTARGHYATAAVGGFTDPTRARRNA